MMESAPPRGPEARLYGRYNTRPLFSIAGIPVSISPWHFALLGMIFYAWFKQSVPLGIGVVIIASFSVLMHEMGHALVARYFHLRPSISLISFGGVTHHQPTRRPRDQFLVTAAGPATNFLLALILAIVSPSGDAMLAQVLYTGMWVNAIWGVFNLAPVWPLDGGILLLVILRKLMPRGDRADRAVHWTGVIVSGLGGLWALSSGSILLLFILGMTGFDNWRMLQALGRSPVRHETESHAPVRDMLVQARSAYEKGEFDTATRLCHQARAEPFLSLDEVRHVWQILALSAARQGRFDDAIRFAERLPDSAEMAQVQVACIQALDEAARASKFLASPSARLVDSERLAALRELSRRSPGAVG